MILTAFINDAAYDFDVPQKMLDEGESFFSKLDADMEGGYQMSREFVENPGRKERCQIVADRLLDALNDKNVTLCLLLCAYIIDRMPGVTVVRVDTDGDIFNTHFGNADEYQAAPKPTDEEARNKATEDLSDVYKVGRVYKFSLRDLTTGKWEEAPAAKTEDEAKKLRRNALENRCKELKGRIISQDMQ